jgi:hypothetical protein
MPWALRELRRQSSTAATRSSGVRLSYQKAKSASADSSLETTTASQMRPWRSVAVPRRCTQLILPPANRTIWLRRRRLLVVASPPSDRPGEHTVAAAQDWLGDLGDDTPFFLWVHFYDPHAAYNPPPPYRSTLHVPWILWLDAVPRGVRVPRAARSPTTCAPPWTTSTLATHPRGSAKKSCRWTRSRSPDRGRHGARLERSLSVDILPNVR